MTRKLGPEWSEAERASGQEMAATWDAYFAAAEKEQPGQEERLVGTAQQAVTAIMASHQDRLLRYPNVVAVAPGIATKGGKPTGEPCLVVFVSQKVAADKLAADELLPQELDGVRIDVVAVGDVSTLPAS